MIETIYHRCQKPWVEPKLNSAIGVKIRVKKNSVERIYLIFGDPMGDWKNDIWNSRKVIMKKITETQHHDIYYAEINIKTKRYRYGFNIMPKSGNSFIYGECGEIKDIKDISVSSMGFTYSYWNNIDLLETPNWFSETSWYQIFPDRFAKNNSILKTFVPWDKKPQGHEIYGGNLKGIIQKLPYIKSLGFDGIYLTPIFKAETSHRYDTKDYYEIDPILGDEEDFKSLIRECHKLNMKIMLDAVLNHIGYHSKEFQDVIKNKSKSKYKDWFWINDFENLKQPKDYKEGEFEEKYPYETFALTPTMPRFNWGNKEAQEHLLKAAEKWTKMGIDGWRLDVSFEPPKDFWRKFNKRVKSINNKIVIIGEVWWDSIEYLERDIWHGIMNYPLREIIIEFVKSNQNKRDKEIFVEKFNELTIKYTPEQQWGMFNLLSSHDLPRFITELKGDKKRFEQAMKLCFFQPGSPSTYYGEEIGLEGFQDPDNRRSFPWESNKKTYFDFFKSLNKERKEFVKTSNKFEHYLAKIERDQIILYNSTNQIYVKNLDVKRNKSF